MDPVFDEMHVILAVVVAIIAFSFWRMHRNPLVNFSLFDLVMENGKASKTGVAFMLTLGVTTWLIIDLEMKGKMTEGFLSAYGMMWVAPLVARVIFGKTDLPAPKAGGA
jgi:hypothetical protein